MVNLIKPNTCDNSVTSIYIYIYIYIYSCYEGITRHFLNEMLKMTAILIVYLQNFTSSFHTKSSNKLNHG